MARSADGATVVAVFDPARLTLARQAAGWSKKQLAEAIDRTPAAVTQYEAGLARPSAGVLDTCAAQLDVPVGFFARGRPRLPLDVGDAHFRSLRSARVVERMRALATVELIWELTEQLSRSVRLPVLDLPDLGQAAANPRTAARALRAAWNIPAGPVPHLVRLLESKGIVVAFLSFSDAGRVDAFSTAAGGRPTVVLTADKGNGLRTRFTAAHELAHLLLHTDVIPGDIAHEREADAFAAEFLMPAAQIAAELPTRVDLPALLDLQQRWGVSVAALLYRCRELGTLSEASYKRAMMQISRLGWRTHEPGGDLPVERPALLTRAFDLAASAGVSIGTLSDALQLPAATVRTLLGMTDHRPVLHLVSSS
ncbi:MAG TPA: XRE family transcriptional regulator [Pseudonocardiaceae bacterium]|nr:XRE family transcriptional regulator [Pseudonocardiaceae bacterium]